MVLSNQHLTFAKTNINTMYKIKEWASKIKPYKGKNAYHRLLWLMNNEKNEYVTKDFIEEAKKALEHEHRMTIAFLNGKLEKFK